MPYQPRVRVSTVVPAPVDEVWDAVRAFDSIDEWHPVITDCTIEGGESPLAIDSIRNFTAGDNTVRERLVALSDVDHYYRYVMEEGGGDRVDYLSELTVESITESDETLATWWAHYDVVEGGDPAAEAEHLQNVFRGGLDGLREQFSE